MTRKSCPRVNASVPDTNDRKSNAKEEHLGQIQKDLHQHDAGKRIGAPQNNDTTECMSKTTKAAQPNARRVLLAHICCAVFAWLLVMFAVNDFKLASIADLYSPAPSVNQSNSATSSPTSLSRGTDSSSSPTSSYTTHADVYLAACTLSPQNQSLLSIVSSACSCLILTSSTTEYDDTVTVTSVGRHMGTVSRMPK